MTNRAPGNWQASAKSTAFTILVIAVALYVAVQLIDAVADVLIVIASVAMLTYVIVLVVRYRRSRW